MIGLFHPTPQDVRDMQTWGYHTFTPAYLYLLIYYLPGHFSP